MNNMNFSISATGVAVDQAHKAFHSPEGTNIAVKGAKVIARFVTGPALAVAGLIEGVVTGLLTALLFLPSYASKTLGRVYEALKNQSADSFKASAAALKGMFGYTDVQTKPSVFRPQVGDLIDARNNLMTHFQGDLIDARNNLKEVVAEKKNFRDAPNLNLKNDAPVAPPMKSTENSWVDALKTGTYDFLQYCIHMR